VIRAGGEAWAPRRQRLVPPGAHVLSGECMEIKQCDPSQGRVRISSVTKPLYYHSSLLQRDARWHHTIVDRGSVPTTLGTHRNAVPYMLWASRSPQVFILNQLTHPCHTHLAFEQVLRSIDDPYQRHRQQHFQLLQQHQQQQQQLSQPSGRQNNNNNNSSSSKPPRRISYANLSLCKCCNHVGTSTGMCRGLHPATPC
jgi:hypothetical protein